MTNDLHDDVRRAGQIVARRWPGVIEADDAEQEIWVRLLDSSEYDAVAAMDGRMSLLIKIGSQVALKYRNDYEVFSAQVYYGTDEVRAMLGGGLLDRRRDEIDVASETLTEWLDLHEAVQALRDSHPRYAEAIWAVWLLKETITDWKSVTRAVDQLTIHMNRIHRQRGADRADGPGTRHTHLELGRACGQRIGE